MSNEQKQPNAISEAALKVFSREELLQMPRPQRLTLLGLIAKRLEKDGPEPTLDELEGTKELVTEHLWSPGFNKQSEALQNSTRKPEST